MSEKDFAGFSSFSDEKLLAALDSESYEPAYYVSGHLARELIYDEIRVRGLRSRKAKLLALFGLYREPRDSHALSACQSCLETIFDVPAHVKEAVFSNLSSNVFRINQMTHLEATLPLINYCVKQLAAEDE